MLSVSPTDFLNCIMQQRTIQPRTLCEKLIVTSGTALSFERDGQLLTLQGTKLSEFVN